MPFAFAKGIVYRVDLISRILCVSDAGIIYLGSASPPTSCGVPGAFCGAGHSPAPVSPCSRWGLPGQRHCCHHRCALTAPFHPRIAVDAICSLLHLPSGYPARPLTGIVTLWSADFPRQAQVLPRFPRSTRISYYTAEKFQTDWLGQQQASSAVTFQRGKRMAPDCALQPWENDISYSQINQDSST